MCVLRIKCQIVKLVVETVNPA